jgi:hypothetical protein
VHAIETYRGRGGRAPFILNLELVVSSTPLYAMSLVRKPERKRPLGRPRRRWEDNIRMDLQEVGCGGMDWIALAQLSNRWGAIVTEVINLRVQ